MEYTARAQLAEVLRSSIGTGGRAGKPDYNVATLVRVDNDVGGADKEHRLGVAEYKVQSAVADLDIGHVAGTG